MILAGIIFVAILCLLAYLDTKKPKNFPPGPQWLPIIGSAWTIYKLRKKNLSLCRATGLLSRQYGPVVGLRVGSEKFVVVYGEEAMKEFLSEDDLSGRPLGLFYSSRTWGERKGILLTDEDLWTDQRRFVIRNLRDFGFGRKNMSLLICEEAETLVQVLRDQVAKGNGSHIQNMNDMFGIHVLNTLWTMLAGVKYSPEDKKLRRLQKILNDLFINIDMVGTLFSQFPILKHIAPGFSGYTMYMKTHSNIWKFLDEELQRHRETYDPENIRDFMDLYLGILNSPEKSEHFSERQLLAICLDLFMAGSETTSKSLAYGFLYLLHNPQVQAKAQQEIDRVIGRDRTPTLEDRPQMKYMEATVLEIVRIYMSRAIAVPHRALRDTNLQGYFIPKDTMLVANMEGMLTGPDWKDPHAFNPDRFIKDGKVCFPNSYIPFGMGRHRCIGETLAKGNIFVFVAALLQNFNFSVVPGTEPPSTVEVDGVTPSPAPYHALITLRPR